VFRAFLSSICLPAILVVLLLMEMLRQLRLVIPFQLMLLIFMIWEMILVLLFLIKLGMLGKLLIGIMLSIGVD